MASSFDSNLLTPMVWLVAGQFGLYAIGWLLSSVLLREERAATLCWAGFMACIGLGFLLITGRGEPRTWLAFNGSGVAFVAGLLLLWAGLLAFYRRPAMHREIVLTFAVVAGVLAFLGPDADDAPLRVLFTYGVNIWVTVRVVISLHGAVKADHGTRKALLIASPGVLIVAAFAVPFTRQLLNLDRPLELHRFDDSNLRSLYIYLGAAAVFSFGFAALVIHRLLSQLRALSDRDALTNLFNRRAMERDLQREWRRWLRKRDRFAVLMLDLDHFKQVNDTHGHPTGDEVLKHTANRLTAQARDTDVVARTGGEEFIVLLPATTRDGAIRVGERLLANLRETPLALSSAHLRVTASIGAAIVEAGDANVDAVLARADQALYRAKAQGRDRVVFLP